MDFEVSEKMKTIIEMMDEFVEKELIPMEPEFLKRAFVDMLPELEEKRRMVRQMELWAPQHPGIWGDGPGSHGICPRFGIFGTVTLRPLCIWRPCPGRRQHRNPSPPWHGGTEGKVSAPPGGGQDQELFFHDRGGDARLQSSYAGNHSSKRWK